MRDEKQTRRARYEAAVRRYNVTGSPAARREIQDARQDLKDHEEWTQFLNDWSTAHGLRGES